MPALMHNISTVYRCSSAYMQEALEAHGLRAGHASYLVVVCKTPGITQDQLAKRIFINKSNVARQLAFLEDAGFVERMPSPSDKRAILVYPSDKAIEIYPQIRQIFRDWESMIAQDLTPDEQQMMIEMLSKMKARAAGWMEENMI
jgi:DNA-binding MarR family transcriptional regulator